MNFFTADVLYDYAPLMSETAFKNIVQNGSSILSNRVNDVLVFTCGKK
jgi:hypothetical protein